MESPPRVECGWKRCLNTFPTVEGMNVHVQADHMVYRVLVQTEYQGNTHVAQPTPPTAAPATAAAPAHEHRAPARAMKEEALSARSTPRASPTPPAPPQLENNTASSSQQQAPQQEQQELVETPQPYPEITVAPGATGGDGDGGADRPPLIKMERKVVVVQRDEEEPEEEEEMEEEEEEEEEQQEAPVTSGALVMTTPELERHLQIKAPLIQATVTTVGAAAGASTSSSFSRKRGGGGGRGDRSREKKGRSARSKYWTYTTQLTYRCNNASCNAEFSNANAARHHYNMLHTATVDTNNNVTTSSANGGQSIVSASTASVPKRRRSSTGGSSSNRRRSTFGSKRQHCSFTGCTRFFMSKAGLDNHMLAEHQPGRQSARISTGGSAPRRILKFFQSIVGEPEEEEDDADEEEEMQYQQDASDVVGGSGDHHEEEEEEEVAMDYDGEEHEQELALSGQNDNDTSTSGLFRY